MSETELPITDTVAKYILQLNLAYAIMPTERNELYGYAGKCKIDPRPPGKGMDRH